MALYVHIYIYMYINTYIYVNKYIYIWLSMMTTWLSVMSVNTALYVHIYIYRAMYTVMSVNTVQLLCAVYTPKYIYMYLGVFM